MDLGGITAGSRIFWDTLVVEKIIENCAQNHTFPPVLLHKSGFFPSPPETCQVGAPMSWLHGGTQITWGGSVPCEEEPICHMEIGVSDLHGPAQPQPQSNLSEVCPIPYPHHSHGPSTRFWPTGISVSHRNGRVPHDSDASRFWSKKSSSSQALSNCPATFHAVSLCLNTSPAQRLMLGLITESDRMKHKNTIRRYMYCVSQSPSTSALT